MVIGEMAGSRHAHLREVERRAVEAERTRDEAAPHRPGPA